MFSLDILQNRSCDVYTIVAYSSKFFSLYVIVAFTVVLVADFVGCTNFESLRRCFSSSFCSVK